MRIYVPYKETNIAYASNTATSLLGGAVRDVVATLKDYRDELVKVEKQSPGVTVVLADRIYTSDRGSHLFIWATGAEIIACWNNTNHHHPNHMFMVKAADAIKRIDEKLEKYFA